MVRKGKLAIFEGSSVSETGEALPQTWGEVLFKVFKYIPSTLQILRVQYEYEYRFQ